MAKATQPAKSARRVVPAPRRAQAPVVRPVQRGAIPRLMVRRPAFSALSAPTLLSLAPSGAKVAYPEPSLTRAEPAVIRARRDSSKGAQTLAFAKHVTLGPFPKRSAQRGVPTALLEALHLCLAHQLVKPVELISSARPRRAAVLNAVLVSPVMARTATSAALGTSVRVALRALQ